MIANPCKIETQITWTLPRKRKNRIYVPGETSRGPAGPKTPNMQSTPKEKTDVSGLVQSPMLRNAIYRQGKTIHKEWIAKYLELKSDNPMDEGFAQLAYQKHTKLGTGLFQVIISSWTFLSNCTISPTSIHYQEIKATETPHRGRVYRYVPRCRKMVCILIDFWFSNGKWSAFQIPFEYRAISLLKCWRTFEILTLPIFRCHCIFNLWHLSHVTLSHELQTVIIIEIHNVRLVIAESS
jgi:hypothetical protein